MTSSGTQEMKIFTVIRHRCNNVYVYGLQEQDLGYISDRLQMYNLSRGLGGQVFRPVLSEGERPGRVGC